MLIICETKTLLNHGLFELFCIFAFFFKNSLFKKELYECVSFAPGIVSISKMEFADVDLNIPTYRCKKGHG